MKDHLSALKTIKTINIPDEKQSYEDNKTISRDFEVKQFDNLILNKDCSYINEPTSSIDFYQCPCTEGFSLICKACADKCHKGHNTYFCGSGNHVCKCGKTNHIIPHYEKEQKSPCLYHTFFEIVPNQMYDQYLDKSVEPYNKVTLCLVCKTGCNSKGNIVKEEIDLQRSSIFQKLSLSKSINQEVGPKRKYCECKDHHEFNPIQINSRFLKNKELKGTMLNFNVNIMFKIQDSKKNYIEELTTKLDEYFKNKSDLGNYEFFEDWMNFNAFEMFSLFFQNWKTKYTTMVPFLEKYKREDLLNLLSIPKELTNRLKVGIIEENILSGKLYYADLLFNYFIKSTFIKSNNLFSIKTILNMPLEQRFLFLHKARDYYKYKNIKRINQNKAEIEKEKTDWEFIQTLAHQIIESFETITKDSEQLYWEALDKSFATFNRIMKYLIKYNILSEELKERYVIIVIDTLQLFIKKKGQTLENTSLSIMKSILYLMIYRNDNICFNDLGFNRQKKLDKEFAFVYDDFNMKLSKIYLITIGHKNIEGNVKERLQFDYCVKRLNELMLFTQDNYIYSICKSEIIPNDPFHSLNTEITHEIIKNLNPEHFNGVCDFVQNLNNENQCYFLYAQSLELYLSHTITILSEFRQWYQTYNTDQLIPEADTYTQMTDQSDFKRNFFYSTLILPFFQKLDELIHIYANGKCFGTEAQIISQTVDEAIEKEFSFILDTYYISLIDKDPSLITILINIKPNIFIQTFKQCKRSALFNYLNKLADIWLSRMNYQAYDSFYFFTGCILELLKSYSHDLIYLPDIMKFSSKILRNGFKKEESFLTIVEVFSEVFKELSILENLNSFFIDLTKKIDSDEKETISDFYETYFMFLCDLVETDCFFFDYIKNEIVNIDDIYSKVLEENNLKPMLTVQIMRYYYLKSFSFNFKISNSSKQLRILFNDNTTIEDLNIPFIKLWPKVVNDKNDPGFFAKYIKSCFGFNSTFNEKLMSKDIKLTDKNIFEWYEHVVIRPYYKILSLSTLDLKALTGKYINSLYELVRSFYEITMNIYGIRRFSYDKLSCIKFELTEIEFELLNFEREASFENIKYYEIEKIISFFVFILNIIIKPKDDKYNENDPLKTLYDESLKKTPLYLIAEKYLQKKKDTSDDNLIVIKTISSLISETDLPIREYIINYFLSKLFCQMTDISSAVYDIQEFTIQNSKLQNNYALLFLNKYFCHDSKQFQLAFEKHCSEDASNDNSYALDNKKTLLTYLSLNLIFPSILLETEKLYSLDLLNGDTINRNISLTYKMGKYAMKFIQNLCEKYNKINKSLFFTSCFEPKVKEDEGKKDLFNEEFELVQNGDFKPRSFFNFLSCNVRIINQNLYQELKMQRNTFAMMTSVGKNLENEKMLHKGISDLIIELVQGTESYNFQFIYFDEERRVSNDILNLFKNQLGDNFIKSKGVVMEKCKKQKSNYDSAVKERSKLKPEQLEKLPMLNEPKKFEILFQFIIAIIEIRDNLYDKEDLFNSNTLAIKTQIFVIIENIITQDEVPKEFINVILKIFDMKQLIQIVIMLLKGLYVKHCTLIDYQSPDFKSSLEKIKLDKDIVRVLTKEYKNVKSIFPDGFFELASQIYLVILTISEKYQRAEAEMIIGSKYCLEDNLLKSNDSDGMLSTIKRWLYSSNEKEKEKKIIVMEGMKDTAYTCLFMSNIIKHCEFRVDNKSAILYFVINPCSFLISNNTIESFIETVDRHSSTTKLNGLVASLDYFMDEIKENSSGMVVNYQELTYINFYIALFINLILLLFLHGIGEQQRFLYYLGAIAIIFQLLLNLLFIVFFLTTKYKFYITMQIKYKQDEEFSLINYVNIYLLDSFLLNDEIFFINYVFLMGVLAICIPRYNLFFYVLQLLTVLEFVDTIKEILIAFKIRFSQLFCMIGFLVILLYFYSNIGFYFYIDEFNTVIDNKPENICQTMIECLMTYFNHGVRAGGGIGDVLGDKTFTQLGMYYLRFTTDLIFYITVILLLLNMINGVIVSTFSQIRESSSEKENDKNDICFICNVNRKSFEKRKLDFDIHKKEEHSLRTYIHFFVTIKKKDEKDLDETESKILDCIKEKQNKCFPVKQTIYVEDLDENE